MQHIDKVLVPFAPDDPSHRTFVELEGLHETIRGGVGATIVFSDICNSTATLDELEGSSGARPIFALAR
jgi:hypothetical protein